MHNDTNHTTTTKNTPAQNMSGDGVGTIDRSCRRRHRRRGRSVGIAAGVTAAMTAGIALATVGVSAAEADNDATFTPITPCRVLDTRPDYNIGGRTTPIGPDEVHVQQVTGSNGDCTIPGHAIGVAFNATAVAPSAASHSTFYPADATLPNASNLNYVPGMPPTPNKVDVKLSGDGKVAIHNKFGEVHMVVDITGYYSSTRLDDIEARQPRAYAAAGDSTSTAPLTTAETVVLDIDVADTGIDGTLVANYHVAAASVTDDPQLRCALHAPGEVVEMPITQIWTSEGGADNGTLSGTRTFEFTSGAPTNGSGDVRLSCWRYGPGVLSILNSSLTATFIAD